MNQECIHTQENAIDNPAVPSDSKPQQQRQEEDDISRVVIYSSSMCVCRYCRQTCSRTSVIASCKCKEYRKYIHRYCLDIERASSLHPNDYYKCSICRHKYMIRHTQRATTPTSKKIKFYLILYTKMILLLLVLFIVTLLITLALKNYDNGGYIPILFGLSNHLISYWISATIVLSCMIGSISTLLYGSRSIMDLGIQSYCCSNQEDVPLKRMRKRRIKCPRFVKCIYNGVIVIIFIGIGIVIYSTYCFIVDSWCKHYSLLSIRILDTREVIEDFEGIEDI